MAGYSRQSSFADTDIIEAADHNGEYNQLVAAFDEATGHKHDGTADEGPVIGLIGDAGDTTPTNKVEIDTANNNIGFWVDVAATAVEQFIVADGKIEPVTDNDIDLGSATKEFKDLYLDGVAYLDSISLVGNTISAFIDDDTMATASATSVASSESIKAYTDAQITALGVVGDLVSTNNLSDISNATTARTNLGLVIGTDVQAHDAFLDDVAALVDPNDDRILFWDDSAGAVTWLDLGSGISITGTTLTATGTAASSATTTTEGIVELATTAEVTTGTDTSRAVTPIALNDGYQGTANIDTLGTITTGTWNATDIPLSAGGTGASLSDPLDDRILFWDNSAGAMTWLDIGTGLTLTGTTLDADATAVPSASTTVEGTVELATIAETNTGTDTTRAVTPDGLDGWTGSAQITTLGTISTGTWNGSNIGITNGGTGASLADPNADRIMFWDDSATSVAWLTVGSGLTITGTTITGGGLTDVIDDTTPTLGGDLDGAGNDIINVYLKDWTLAQQSLGTASGSQNLDLSLYNYFSITTNGATTFIDINTPAAVASFMLEIVNGGGYVITYPTGTQWASGTAPTLTTTGTDILTFTTNDGGVTWYGTVYALNVS